MVDMEWKEARVVSLTITSRSGGKTKVNYNGTSKTVKLKAGNSIKLL